MGKTPGTKRGRGKINGKGGKEKQTGWRVRNGGTNFTGSRGNRRPWMCVS